MRLAAFVPESDGGKVKLIFRPLVGFTLVCLSIFALLVGLGLWQLERLNWKLRLIEQMNRNLAAAPISLNAALALGDQHAQYRRVMLKGRFEHSKENYLYTTGPEGGAAYHLLTPLLTDDGRAMLIDRGYLPATMRDPAFRPGSEPQGEVAVIGVWRTPDRPGPFTPAPDFAHRIWFARDVAGIARADDLRLAAPAILEATMPRNARGWPRGGQTRVDLPNDHLQYALTWFLLAGALAVAYVAYHYAHGGLSFGNGRR